MDHIFYLKKNIIYFNLIKKYHTLKHAFETLLKWNIYQSDGITFSGIIMVARETKDIYWHNSIYVWKNIFIYDVANIRDRGIILARKQFFFKNLLLFYQISPSMNWIWTWKKHVLYFTLILYIETWSENNFYARYGQILFAQYNDKPRYLPWVRLSKRTYAFIYLCYL